VDRLQYQLGAAATCLEDSAGSSQSEGLSHSRVFEPKRSEDGSLEATNCYRRQGRRFAGSAKERGFKELTLAAYERNRKFRHLSALRLAQGLGVFRKL